MMAPHRITHSTVIQWTTEEIEMSIWKETKIAVAYLSDRLQRDTEFVIGIDNSGLGMPRQNAPEPLCSGMDEDFKVQRVGPVGDDGPVKDEK
jgi:hypothetical protein